MLCNGTNDEPLFDPEELAELRADFKGMLEDRCQVMRQSRTRDSGGGWVNTYAPHGPVIRCRTWNGQTPGDLLEVAQGAAISDIATWRVLLPFGADVLDTDRLSVTSKARAVVTFEVAGTDAGASDALGVLCLCKKIRGDA